MPTTLSIDPKRFLGLPLGSWGNEWSTTAVSGEARQITENTRDIDNTLERSRTLFGTKSEAISELRSVAEECGEQDWDGEGALALKPWAIRTAERIIRVLPDDIPMPEITPEPDGSVGLDWSVAPYRVFSVSAGNDLRLACAWLDGTDRGHAVVRFDGENIPRLILDGVKSVLRTA